MRIGISGTGFIAQGIAQAIDYFAEFETTAILTRRPVAETAHLFPEGHLTDSIEHLVESADVVVECSGDAVHAAQVMMAAGMAGRTIVTMNSEAQVTVASALVRRGFMITEAHGDQPGCLAELAEEASDMCFRPLAYVNLKGFLNHTPSQEDMLYWSERQGLSLRQVTSFTDGSKLQIEQALVANGLGARIVKQGMIGGRVDDLAELDYLARAAREVGAPISEYVVNPGGPPGVLILAESPIAAMKDGYLPFTRLLTKEREGYVLIRPHHLVHLEIGKTLRRLARGESPLINNGPNPTVTVAAVAKHAIPRGTLFEAALGGFDLRGEVIEVAGNEDVVPITLLDGARLRNAVEPGQVLRQTDVDIPETLAAELYWSTIENLGTNAESDLVNARSSIGDPRPTSRRTF